MPEGHIATARRGSTFPRGMLRQFLGLLGGAVTLTLLSGCANLAGLLLAWTEACGPELAVRTALGAGRARLVRTVAVDAGVLAAAGGVLNVYRLKGGGLRPGTWDLKMLVARTFDQGLLPFKTPGARSYLNVSRFLNSIMMNSAAASPMLCGRCTFASPHPSDPASTAAGSVLPSGSVKLKS
jgi:hypothetical protein